MTKRIGLYPGTFDPITLGHVDIVERAVKLVDELVIGVAINRDKGPLFALEERVAMVSGEMGPIAKKSGVAIRVVPFESLLTHFAEQVKAGIIIRGLRAVSDFEYEFQMVGMNQALNRDIETVFLMADARTQAIASKLVKEIARLGGDVSSFVPPAVVSALKKKFGNGESTLDLLLLGARAGPVGSRLCFRRGRGQPSFDARLPASPPRYGVVERVGDERGLARVERRHELARLNDILGGFRVAGAPKPGHNQFVHRVSRGVWRLDAHARAIKRDGLDRLLDQVVKELERRRGAAQ